MPTSIASDLCSSIAVNLNDSYRCSMRADNSSLCTGYIRHFRVITSASSTQARSAIYCANPVSTLYFKGLLSTLGPRCKLCLLPNIIKQKEKAPYWVPSLCWRYLFFRAVSSQVSWAEASLTSVFGMGTGGPSP